MKNVLIIQSSPRLEQSTTRKVAENFLKAIKENSPETKITIRDLAHNPVPHLTNEVITAFYTPEESRTKEANQAALLSDTLTQELLDADTIVLTAPMWNFGVPSVVKAWIEHISRAGKTFSYTANGIEGLAKGKKVYVITSSGSVFSEGPFKKYDMLEPYLRTFFGFIGITDVEMIRAEGVRGPADEERELLKTQKEINTIFSR
jgi:FMN-dependent NADH-azoreductase